MIHDNKECNDSPGSPSPEDVYIPPCQPHPVKYLSEEVREVLGCELPDIDLFQTQRAFIGIPRDIISGIIHKGNSISLSAAPFNGGKDMVEAFNLNLHNIQYDVNDISDCFAGIFIGRNVRITMADLIRFAAHFQEVFPKPVLERVRPFWGFYRQDSLPEATAQIVTVATTPPNLNRNPSPFGHYRFSTMSAIFPLRWRAKQSIH